MGRQTKQDTLEEQLNDIVAGLIAAAAVQREQRISQEEAARRHQQEELERWKRQEAEEAEARRFEDLIRQAGQWRQANEIRAYVKAIKDRARTARRGVSSPRLREWAAWAIRHADRIDLISSVDGPQTHHPTNRDGEKLGGNPYR